MCPSSLAPYTVSRSLCFHLLLVLRQAMGDQLRPTTWTSQDPAKALPRKSGKTWEKVGKKLRKHMKTPITSGK